MKQEASSLASPFQVPKYDLADFGNELDFIANYKLTPRVSILAGYSHLWRGSKIISTNDADFFYLQTTLNF